MQEEVWTVAHGGDAIRAAARVARARLALVVGSALAVAAIAIAVAVVPAHALAASLSAQPTPHTNRPATSCPGANLQPTRTNTTVIEAATLCLIDLARATNHLAPLHANRQLQTVAVSQVTSMVKLDYFADDRPTGTTPMMLILDSGYAQPTQRISIAEDIGWGTLQESTPAQMVAGWMDSPPHREAILNRGYSDAGVGAVAAVPGRLAQGQSGATYALELARR